MMQDGFSSFLSIEADAESECSTRSNKHDPDTLGVVGDIGIPLLRAHYPVPPPQLDIQFIRAKKLL